MPVMSEGDSTVNVSGLSYDHAENDTSKRTIILTYIIQYTYCLGNCESL